MCNCILYCQCITVPTPTISVTTPNTQTVGQSLTLQCEVTTVIGITSRVDIVWRSGGTVLQRMNGVSSTMMSNLLVYTNFYTISQLSTTDDGKVIQCEGVINASPSVMASNDITLDVTGMFIVTCVPLVVNCSNLLLLYYIYYTHAQLIVLVSPCVYYNLLYIKLKSRLSVHPSVCPFVCPSASRDNLSGFCMDRLGTWFVHN